MTTIRQIPWTEQPPAGSSIAPEWVRVIEVLQSGPLVYFKRGNLNRPSIYSGSPTIGPDVGGITLKTTGGRQAFLSPRNTDVLSGDGFTLEVLCAVTSVPSLAGFFSVGGSNGTASIGSVRGLIAFSGGSNKNIYFWGGAADLASGVDWREDSKPQHVFVTSVAGAGSPMTFYRDGVIIATGTTPAVIDATVSGTPYYTWGDTDQGWNSTPTGAILKSAHYNRALSAHEIAEMTKNPWQVFAPSIQRFWAPFLSGAYTLNAETGVYTFTGSNATLLHNYALTLESASYSLTGSNATLLKGLILDAASGSYILTGSNATLVYNKLLNASSGSYSVTGADANLIYTPTAGAYVLNAESGAYVLTGSDVTFSYSGGTITLKAGSWIRYRIIT